MIDLKTLASRENATVEWKENGDDIDVASSIAKTISAFANDISNFGGGYVVCGAKETKDVYGFQKVVFTGLSANKLKEIEGKVLQYCRDYISPSVVPVVEELDNPEDDSTRLLVFIVHADSQAHTYRDGQSSNYYVRIGRETRVAMNGVFRQLMENKQSVESFDKRPNPNVGMKDIDIFVFRDCMEKMGFSSANKPFEDYLSADAKIAEFLPPLLAKMSLDGDICLRNFTLLMFGEKDSIYRWFDEAYIIVSVYNGVDRGIAASKNAKRYTLTGTIIEQAKKAIDLLDVQLCTIYDKDSDRPHKEKYPARAIREAVINAVVHRDYQIDDPIRITIFSDRIEIRSPGVLHWSLDREKFKIGQATPKWRNQSFAYIFNKLRFTEAEGQGIRAIIESMREEGCPDPIFEIEPQHVNCILPANPKWAAG